VDWREEAKLSLDLIAGGLLGPGRFYDLERELWHDLWRVPALDAVEGDGIETRRYGPVRAFTIAAAPREPLLNLVLGAAAPGAVAEGHLDAALEWTESLGVECRIPIPPDAGESAAAEDRLNHRGYRRAATDAMLVRDDSPPRLPPPPGIEVDEHSEESEGFSTYLGRGYGIECTSDDFFIALPAQRCWRAYVAVDAERQIGIGAAATMRHYQVAQLGFASTVEDDRGRGVHAALIQRRLEDALAAGARRVFAVTEEPLEFPEADSPAARNLTRAGFAPAATRTVWKPPEELLAEDEDEGEWDDEDEWDGDEDGLDGDHDFELGG
jgi:GNAT superfamily N-acetyltransferase